MPSHTLVVPNLLDRTDDGTGVPTAVDGDGRRRRCELLDG